MEEKDFNGIPEQEDAEMEQVEFVLEQPSSEMDQISFELEDTSPPAEQETDEAALETPEQRQEPAVTVQVQEMSADELNEFVFELENSVNELDDFVDEMNEIVNDKSETAVETDETVKGQSVQKTILSYLHDIAFGMVAILLLFMIVFRVIVVSGPSMKQTLQHGDTIILLNSFFYREPKVGDIVVATKTSYKDGEPIIKRVIATEGQVVDIDFDLGVVYVDGVALDEPYTNTPTNLYEGVTFPVTVQEGCVFVMGDNRNDSKDSRSIEIGQIDRRELLGKAMFLLIPGVTEEVGAREFDRIGALW